MVTIKKEHDVMKQFRQLKTLISGLTLSVVVVAASGASAFAAPATSAAPATKQPVSGPQAKPAIEPGSKDAKATEKLGSTDQVKVDASGKPQAAAKSVTPLVGNVSGVDFQPFYNYCWKNLVYTTVRNTTNTVKYIHVTVYNQGASHDVYASIAAGGSYVYPAFYGIDGAYSAYLYVWNGSSYAYDEYMGGTNTCNVSVTRTYNTGGWVQLKIQNLGTAYATQVSSELAPYPGSGTYTGTQYDYPVAGGAAIYRWFYVGTQPYGITSYTYGSFNSPYLFSGDL
jgi:hypothetical protein